LVLAFGSSQKDKRSDMDKSRHRKKKKDLDKWVHKKEKDIDDQSLGTSEKVGIRDKLGGTKRRNPWI
jgi:hypothetical protein